MSNLSRSLSKNKQYVLTETDTQMLKRAYSTQNVQHDIFNNRFPQIQFPEPNEYSNLYPKQVQVLFLSTGSVAQPQIRRIVWWFTQRKKNVNSKSVIMFLIAQFIKNGQQQYVDWTLDALAEYCTDMAVYQIQAELFRLFQGPAGAGYLSACLERAPDVAGKLFFLFGLCTAAQLTEEQTELARTLAPSDAHDLDQISAERLIEVFLRTPGLKSAIPTPLALRAPLTQNRASLMAKLKKTGFALGDADLKTYEYDELQFSTQFMGLEQRRHMAYEALAHYS